MVFRKKSTKAKRSIRKRVYRKKPVVSKAIKTYVKRTISSNIENKIHVDYTINQNIVTASGGTNFTHRGLLPALSQGTSANQRIGNEVKVKSAIIRGSVNLLPYNAVTNPNNVPAYVMVWIVRSKLKNQLFSSSNAPNDFFDTGSSSIGPQGNLLDTMFPINKQSWICYYKRMFKIGAGVTTGGTISGYPDNSSFSAKFYINYTKHLKKLKYADTVTGAQTIPVNTNMNIVYQCVSVDGANSSLYVMSEYHMTNTIIYEDA